MWCSYVKIRKKLYLIGLLLHKICQLAEVDVVESTIGVYPGEDDDNVVTGADCNKAAFL